ncbi:MAG: O-antigen ligase family protein [Patescibacteria group bacterium]|jgi:O-antigen ligase
MTILFYLTAFLFSLGQLGRVSFFNQQVNFYLYEVVLLVTLFFLFFKYQFAPIIIASKKHKPIFLFIFILLLSLLFNLQSFNIFQNIIGLLYFFRLVLYLLYFFYLSHHSFPIKKGLFLIAVLTIFSTFIQYFFYPDLRNLIYQGWDPHLYRTFGVFFDTSIAAAIFGIFFLTVNQPVMKIIYLILVALSFSRSTYLGLSLALIYSFIYQKEFRKIIFFIVFFVTLVAFIPKPSGEGVNLKRLYSIASRAEDYRLGFTLWKKKPILGYGYNRIRYIKNNGSIHSGAGFSSSFLTILVSSGILGLLSFIYVLWSLRKTNKVAPVILIFLSIISLFDNVLLHPFILFLLFINLSDK